MRLPANQKWILITAGAGNELILDVVLYHDDVIFPNKLYQDGLSRVEG